MRIVNRLLLAMEGVTLAMESMRANKVRAFLTIMGVIPTMYDRRWPEHGAFLEEMQRECDQAGVRLFAPVARRQSYLYLSTRGQDYKPVAEAIASAVRDHKQVRRLVGATSD